MSEGQKRVTYLLGAGASAGADGKCLPTIAGFVSALRILSSQISRGEINWSSTPRSSDIKILEIFQSDLRWLLEEGGKYASIDTFARQCYLRGQSADFERIKKFLAAFFILIQEGKLDQRYDSFYAAMMTGQSGNPTLPQHLQVITWNYDYQNERSIGSFLPKSRRLFDTLQVLPHPFWQDEGKRRVFDPDRFSVIHLNGLAGLQDRESNLDVFLEPIIKRETPVTLTEALKVYWNSSIEGNLQSMIRFAWEGEWPALQAAEHVMRQTQVLVVIGYSFPAFNRKVDGLLLKAASLQKIYVQSHKETLQACINRLRALAGRGVAIEGIDNVDQFHIPYEYT